MVQEVLHQNFQYSSNVNKRLIYSPNNDVINTGIIGV